MNAGPRLLIRLGSLGDVVLATAAANQARQAWGDGCLDVLVKSEWEGLWEGHPAVRQVLAWPQEERGGTGVLRWVGRLRRAEYQETIDLQASPRTRLLTALARLSPVRRPRRRNLERRLLVLCKRGGPPPDFLVARSFAEAVTPGGTALPSLHPVPKAQERAKSLLPGPGPRVGLLPGAGHATKRWPLDRFVAVGRAIRERGGPAVPVFFGPDEEELLQRWRRLWPEDGSWLPIREPLNTVAACLERVGMVLTNDSGLMHVAAAVGTPVVALFGPTVRRFGFFPAGEGHRVLEIPGLGCRPCRLHGGSRCPRGHFRCMLDMEVRPVLQALDTMHPRAPAGHDTAARQPGEQKHDPTCASRSG